MLIDSEYSKAGAPNTLVIALVAASWNFDHKNVTWVGIIVVVDHLLYCSLLTEIANALL